MDLYSYLFCVNVLLLVDDEYDWQVIKPEVYATIMDFYASNLPILTEVQPSSETGTFVVIDNFCNSKICKVQKSTGFSLKRRKCPM